MHYYHSYGLNIHSEISIPYFQDCITNGMGDLSIKLNIRGDLEGPCDPYWNLDQLSEKEAVLKINGHGEFLIGRDAITFNSLRLPADEKMVTAYLAGFVMSLLLYKRGLFVLHGCVIEIKGRRAAFLGDGGMGKSTLAAFMIKRGHTLVSDDVIALDMDRNVVLPAHPCVKMTFKTVEMLGIKPDDDCLIHPLFGKYAIRFEKQFSNDPGPLDHIFILNYGENVIQKTSSMDAFRHLNYHSIPTRWGRESNLSHFVMCKKTIDTIPISYFTRRKIISEMDQQISMIENFLSTC